MPTYCSSQTTLINRKNIVYITDTRKKITGIVCSQPSQISYCQAWIFFSESEIDKIKLTSGENPDSLTTSVFTGSGSAYGKRMQLPTIEIKKFLKSSIINYRYLHVFSSNSIWNNYMTGRSNQNLKFTRHIFLEKIYLQDPGNTIADPYQQKRICLNLFLNIWQTCGKDELRQEWMKPGRQDSNPLLLPFVTLVLEFQRYPSCGEQLDHFFMTAKISVGSYFKV